MNNINLKSNFITNKYDVTIDQLKEINVRNDLKMFLTHRKFENICEIGVKDGSNFKHNFLIPEAKKIIAVDIWKETGLRSQNDDKNTKNELEYFYEKMVDLSKRDPRVQVIRDFSTEAAKQFADEFFDFVYIDADHTEAAVTADIQAWWPKVRSGGVLAGHDYVEITLHEGEDAVTFGVIPAVNNFVKEHNLDLHIDNDHPWKSWFIPKP